jgi:hypothetical protein
LSYAQVALSVLALLLAVSSRAHGQTEQPSDRVRDIQESPAEFEDEVVEVEGFVTEYVEEDAKTTRFYYLKDSYGDIIMVRTTGAFPTVGERYRVSGPVSIDPEMNRPYISEQRRSQLSGTTASDTDSGDDQNRDESAGGDGITANTILLMAIGIVVLLLFGLLIYVLYQRQRPQVAAQGGSSLSADTPPPTSEGGDSAGDGSPGQASRESGPEPEDVVQDETVKMHVPPEGTLKFLGSLEVVAGLDDIERIPLHRPPGQDGEEAEITIGRASGPPYKHVELKPRTVSSKQAKLIHDGDCKVVNYASKESNPTRVNGRPMELNESVEIEDGDVLTMGEVELRYSDKMV